MPTVNFNYSSGSSISQSAVFLELFMLMQLSTLLMCGTSWKEEKEGGERKEREKERERERENAHTDLSCFLYTKS